MCCQEKHSYVYFKYIYIYIHIYIYIYIILLYHSIVHHIYTLKIMYSICGNDTPRLQDLKIEKTACPECTLSSSCSLSKSCWSIGMLIDVERCCFKSDKVVLLHELHYYVEFLKFLKLHSWLTALNKNYNKTMIPLPYQFWALTNNFVLYCQHMLYSTKIKTVYHWENIKGHEVSYSNNDCIS